MYRAWILLIYIYFFHLGDVVFLFCRLQNLALPLIFQHGSLRVTSVSEEE